MTFKRLLTGCTIIVCVCLVGGHAMADVFSINPQSTYLRKSSYDTGPDPIAIKLSDLSFAATPGTMLKLECVGDYSPYGGAANDTRNVMLGVFSGSDVLLAPSLLDRVQDAIDAGTDVTTVPAYFSNQPTDVAQDFRIAGAEFSGIVIEVPSGATHLFVSPDDSHFVDNTDQDGDYGIEITLANIPPSALAMILVDGEDAGDSVELPCDHEDGTLVTLDGSASLDLDGDSLEYEWSFAEDSGIALVDSTAAVTDATFPVGVHSVTLTVYDLDESSERKGTLDTASVTVIVFDDTPPLVMVSTDLIALWPANNQMTPVMICVEASDACSDPSSLDITCFLTSNQPDDSDGTGELVGDADGSDGYSLPVPIELTHLGDGLFAAIVDLRAERDGEDPAGRIYSINVSVVDAQGNSGTASTTVVVPHDRRQK